MTNIYSQTVRTRELKFLENVHPTLCVTCHMSRNTCHVSCVMCHKSHDTFFFIGGASWWRVCYQRGLPHLVLEQPLATPGLLGLGTFSLF